MYCYRKWPVRSKQSLSSVLFEFTKKLFCWAYKSLIFYCTFTREAETTANLIVEIKKKINKTRSVHCNCFNIFSWN